MDMRLITARLNIIPASLVSSDELELGLAQTASGTRLALLAPAGSQALAAFSGDVEEYGQQSLMLCPQDRRNAAALRKYLPWLKPQPLGLSTSAGMGDRLGIATPGHVRAVRQAHGVAPIFAQQSIREMQRTGRNPQQVIDDAMWGVFEQGWHGRLGADADHLKTTADIDACVSAGYALYTLDPGQYVNNQPNIAAFAQLNEQVSRLPVELQPPATGLQGKSFDVEGYRISFDDAILLKAILKYGNAITHIVNLAQHLEKACGNHPYEVEISMDETEQPTSPAEHIYIASELQRRGVRWVSFAPRFVGRFEKGVDYIGDLHTFESQLGIHAAIARRFGPYKLSLHSGSDKFSIYPLFMQHTQGLAHLKTAGTSYLEALRTIATINADLIKDIYLFARRQFETDKRSYHVSAQIDTAPEPAEIQDWPALFDQFDAREILHVTFGSVLTARNSDGKPLFYDRIMQVLTDNRELYFDNLVKHFARHLAPFSTTVEV